MSSIAPTDDELIRRALKATVDGPYFPDWEFHTLFGLNRDDVRAVLDAWPSEPSAVPGYETGAEVQRVGVNNAFNNLLGYPHDHDEQLVEDVGVNKQDLALAYARWRREAFDPDARADTST